MSTKIEENTLLIANAPNIPGLSFRRFRGKQDHPQITAVQNACWQHDGLDWVQTVEETDNEYAHLVNCDPYQDMVFVEIDGELVGFCQTNWRRETEGAYIYNAYGTLLPAWRRKGIGSALLAHNEAHLREIAKAHPADAPKFFRCGAFPEIEPHIAGLMESAGYAPVRYGFEMGRPIDAPLPNAPMPAGLEVRPSTMAQFDAILDAANEAFQDHWGHSPITAEDRAAWLNHPDSDISLWKVAWDGDQVAGMVLNYVAHEENKALGRKRGYTENICVRRPWRRRGLARALLVQSIQMFKDMGYAETALGVDTHNPNGALDLYTGVGYVVEKRHTVYQKPMA
jgi:mycothiol synthase